MRDYKPDRRIVERAAELWVRMLRNPKYDNGDASFQGFVCKSLAEKLPSNANDDVLEKFREALIESMMKENERGYFYTSLYVDYGPDEALHNAAEEAGLKMEFPWKTGMQVRDDCLAVSAGYGGQYVYHYPLDNNRWLVTALSGTDIGKVIDYVNGGKPEFVIESEAVAVSA